MYSAQVQCRLIGERAMRADTIRGVHFRAGAVYVYIYLLEICCVSTNGERASPAKA